MSTQPNLPTATEEKAQARREMIVVRNALVLLVERCGAVRVDPWKPRTLGELRVVRRAMEITKGWTK